MSIFDFFKMICTALVIDAFLLMTGLLMGKWYFITSVFSVVVNIISSVIDRIRPKKLGYINLNIKGNKLIDVLYFCSSLIPIFNIVFSVMRYKEVVCDCDEEFIKKYPGKLITPKEAIKDYNPIYEKEPLIYVPTVENEKDIKLEYENISKRKYKDAIELESINSYIDYIALNKNLTKKQKEKLLFQFRNNIICTRKADLSNNTIKKILRYK